MINLIVYMEGLTLLAPRSPTSPIMIEPFLMSHFTVETNMTINMQKINLLKTAGMAITNTARMNLRGFMTYYYSLIEHAIDGNLVLLRWSLAIYEIICVNPFPVEIGTSEQAAYIKEGYLLENLHLKILHTNLVGPLVL